VLNVSWGGVPVGSFRFEESAGGSRNLACRVFNAKLAAKDDAVISSFKIDRLK
jgi:hypothetical protein